MQSKARQGNARQSKAKQGNAKQSNAKQSKRMQSNATCRRHGWDCAWFIFSCMRCTCSLASHVCENFISLRGGGAESRFEDNLRFEKSYASCKRRVLRTPLLLTHFKGGAPSLFIFTIFFRQVTVQMCTADLLNIVIQKCILCENKAYI